MTLEIGARLGVYEVTAKIGEGGMGEVYRARDTKLDRDVALKVLPEAFTADPDRLARFEREARVLASLNHPNIGSIYGLEEAEGQKALVLELIEGPPLADRIKHGPIPVDEALTGEETLTAMPERDYGTIRVSPDGMRIAADVFDEDGNADIWIWRLDDGPLTRLTFDEAADLDPMWTPDGSRVVFHSMRDGGGLFWKAADGTGEVERLMEGQSSGATHAIRPFDWSPDGRLLFDRGIGGATGRDIGTLTLEGARTVSMLFTSEDYGEQTPALSPDGRWLAYQSTESSGSEVYVQPFPNIDDGKWQVSTSGGGAPVWSPDGSRLYYGVQLPRRRLMVSDVETSGMFTPGTPTEALDLSGYRSLSGGGLRSRPGRRAIPGSADCQCGERRGRLHGSGRRPPLARGAHGPRPGAIAMGLGELLVIAVIVLIVFGPMLLKARKK